MAITTLVIYSVLAGLFVASFFRPIFGVLAYITVYIVYNPYVWWGSTFRTFLPWPSFVAVLFLVAGSVLHARKLNWSISRREVELYLFLCAVWVSSLFFGVGVEDNNWLLLEKMTKLFVFIFFFIRVVNSLDHYRLVIWALILSALFLASQAHTLSSGHFQEGRLESLGGIDFKEANGFAAFLAATITFSGIQMLRARWWMKGAYVVGIALMLNAMIMTQSRSVFLGILLALPYALLKVPSEKRKSVYAYLILGVILFFILADVKFLDRMKTIQTEAKSKMVYAQEKALNRLDFWKASWEMFKDRPLGVGIRNYEKLIPTYDPRNTGFDVHNTYLLCCTEIGIFGIMLLLIIITECFLQLRRIRRLAVNSAHNKEITLHAFALGIVLIMYLFGYMMTHSILYTEILWILLSMPICLEHAVQKSLIVKNGPKS